MIIIALSTVIRLFPVLSDCIHFCLIQSNFSSCDRLCPFLSNCVHFCPIESISIKLSPLLYICICSLLSNIFQYFILLSGANIKCELPLEHRAPYEAKYSTATKQDFPTISALQTGLEEVSTASANPSTHPSPGPSQHHCLQIIINTSILLSSFSPPPVYLALATCSYFYSLVCGYWWNGHKMDIG